MKGDVSGKIWKKMMKNCLMCTMEKTIIGSHALAIYGYLQQFV